jgi:iron complex outermembrane receptor protein
MRVPPSESCVFRYRRRALALATACAVPLLAHALPQDLTTVPLEQLLTMEVFSASKFSQSASEAPAVVTVISAADIRAYGWRTLGDVARSVRGLYVSYDRNYSYLGERGFLRPGDYNTRFLLLVDGNRVNDTVYDQAPVGSEFPLDLELVERIEFVPGPGSSVHGSNAFFGVINVITRSAATLAGTRAFAEGGSAGARRIGASGAWQGDGGASFLLAASARDTDGRDLYYPEFDTPDQNRGVATGLDYERGERLLAGGASGALSVTLMHARRVKGVPTDSFAQPFNDPRSQTTDRQTYLNAAWRSPGTGPSVWHARLYWGSYDSVGDYVNDNPARTLNHDGSAARWWGAELSLVDTRFAGHTLVAGAELENDYRLHQYTYHLAPYIIYLEERSNARRAGLYLQDQVALGPRTLLNAGLRYDRTSGQPGALSPRLALIHTLRPGTTFKAIYGLAFRAPNAFERFYAFAGAGGQLANPALARERIRSGELALVQQLGERERLTATVFHNVVSGLITQTAVAGAPETRFENASPIRAYGAELEYERRWSGGAQLRASTSVSRTSAGNQQLNAPARLFKLNLAAPLAQRGWRGAVEAQYVGPRPALAGSTPGFWLANANLVSARLFGHYELSLGVYNLFDRRYADPGSTEHLQAVIPQDGRTLRARIGYVF